MSEQVVSKYTLKDVDDGTDAKQEVTVSVEKNDMALFIHPQGFGTKDGDYAPILLEQLKGTLRLLVWADVNNDEPTHVIDLSGAKSRVGKRG
jgi:hypothetical protein